MIAAVTSWQDWVQLGAALVSAVAACGALVFAWLTVRQTRNLRHDDRRARLGELVGNFAAALLQVVHGAHPDRVGLAVAKAQLAAALASAGESLPASEALLALDGSSDPAVIQLQAALSADELAGNDPMGPPPDAGA